MTLIGSRAGATEPDETTMRVCAERAADGLCLCRRTKGAVNAQVKAGLAAARGDGR